MEGTRKLRKLAEGRVKKSYRMKSRHQNDREGSIKRSQALCTLIIPRQWPGQGLDIGLNLILLLRQCSPVLSTHAVWMPRLWKGGEGGPTGSPPPPLPPPCWPLCLLYPYIRPLSAIFCILPMHSLGLETEITSCSSNLYTVVKHGISIRQWSNFFLSRTRASVSRYMYSIYLQLQYAKGKQ